jgi:hypothetical protein
MHAMKGVGRVRFQLDSGGSLEVEELLFVPELKVILLSISALEDEGYGVMFQHGHVHIYLEGATLDAATVLGVRQGRLYRLLGQPVCKSKGTLDSELVLVTGGCEATSSTVRSLSWYEMTQLDAQECEETPKGMERRNRSSAQDPVQVAGKLSGSEGAATTADGVMGLEIDPGGGSKSTFLAEREC